jgi:hypothetical protein
MQLVKNVICCKNVFSIRSRSQKKAYVLPVLPFKRRIAETTYLKIGEKQAIFDAAEKSNTSSKRQN